MARRLCKLDRRDIAASLGDIYSLVTEPKYLCRSCARSSADKEVLCKPAAIPPKECQAKPLEEQQSCGLLAEALSNTTQVIEPLSDKAAKKAFKQAKKRAKQQNKYHKKLEKVLKKQQKLLKKHQKLEMQFGKVNAQLSQYDKATGASQNHMH